MKGDGEIAIMTVMVVVYGDGDGDGDNERRSLLPIQYCNSLCNSPKLFSLQSVELAALAKQIMAHKPLIAAVVIKRFGTSQVEAAPARDPHCGCVCAVPA